MWFSQADQAFSEEKLEQVNGFLINIFSATFIAFNLCLISSPTIKITAFPISRGMSVYSECCRRRMIASGVDMENKGTTTLMRRYELGKLLGQGTFAKVYHAKDVTTGSNVAIKIIDKEKILRVGMADQIKREISVMKLVRHPNIVQLYEVMASKNKIYFVMEYMRGGELFKKRARGIKEAGWLAPHYLWHAFLFRRLISKILDPNPNTRISIPKIMENPWFRKGFEPSIEREASCDRKAVIRLDTKETGIDSHPGYKPGGTNCSNEQTAKTIISKLEELAGRLGLKVSKKDRGLMKLERSKAGRKGELCIDAEIFEITPEFHLVEVKKCTGDTVEYDQMVKQDIRPALKDIVWAWQGNMPEQLLPQLPEMPQEQHQLSQVPAVLEAAGSAELP
ncbi:OLC1v1033539C1 [Oldenlandia corymbosa var. corymbosa]|uniref:OLC1v1033539C1 n=1 Tax=Oldenlandia corymbosa var. corymbosa TaxID=529605 RepID=A0AAV1CP93_OLDCO|nr:OLC1v1033539C1 [Oldenlandia corymbosa var. corymbosa]